MGNVDIGRLLFQRITISFFPIWYKDAITCGHGVMIREADSIRAGVAASITPTNGRLRLPLQPSDLQAHRLSIDQYEEVSEFLLTFCFNQEHLASTQRHFNSVAVLWTSEVLPRLAGATQSCR